MNAAIAAGLITGGASMLGGWMNSQSQSANNKEQMQFQKDMLQMQQYYNTSMWKQQNEYNDPSSQMERLRKAGLNANLVYGNGSVANTAGDIKGIDTPKWNPTAPRYGDIAIGAGQGLLAYQDYRMKEAQTDNLKAQNTVIAQDAVLRAAQTANTLQNTKGSAFDLEMKENLRSTSIGIADIALRQARQNLDLDAAVKGASIAESKARTKNTYMDAELKELDIELRKLGINPNDPTYMRIFGRVLSGELKPSAVLKNLFNFLK